MSIARTSSVLALFIVSACVTACGESRDEASTEVSESELRVEPADGADADKGVSFKSDDGACVDVKALLDAHKADLEKLCDLSQLPLPKDSDAKGCDSGFVKSIALACFKARAPKAPSKGCQKFDVKDEKNAMASHARGHLGALPGFVCGRLPGMAPRRGMPGREGFQPGGKGGPGQGGPAQGGQGERPDAPPPGGEQGRPGGEQGRPGGEQGRPGGDDETARCEARPQIECCAPDADEARDDHASHEGRPSQGGPEQPSQGEQPSQETR